MVQGLDMAIPLMLIGEKAEVVCDARFAYGTIGLVNEEDNTKTIPPGAKVRFLGCLGIYIYNCYENIIIVYLLKYDCMYLKY